MEKDIPENIKKLAETLKKTGLASSDIDAIEKAKAALGAEDIVKKAQNLDNYFKFRDDQTASELLKETEAEPKEEVKEEPKQKEEKTPEVEEEEKKDIEIKEIDSDNEGEE